MNEFMAGVALVIVWTFISMRRRERELNEEFRKRYLSNVVRFDNESSRSDGDRAIGRPQPRLG